MLHNDLLAVQALVGMAVVLQGSANPYAASVLVASAIRLGQAMGLHRNLRDASLTEAQVEQRMRVFWIAYLLDKDISLRTGQPFAQDDDDMDTELPTGTIWEMPPRSGMVRTINIFNSRIGLAVIQGQIYKRLYSVQGSRQSEAQKAKVAQELSSILSYWRTNVPIDFEDCGAAFVQAPITAEFIHMLLLRFTYVHCLIMIDHHMSPTEGLLSDVWSDAQGVYAFPERICITESRKAIRLINLTPCGDYACVW